MKFVPQSKFLHRIYVFWPVEQNLSHVKSILKKKIVQSWYSDMGSILLVYFVKFINFKYLFWDICFNTTLATVGGSSINFLQLQKLLLVSMKIVNNQDLTIHLHSVFSQLITYIFESNFSSVLLKISTTIWSCLLWKSMELYMRQVTKKSIS